MSYHAQPISCLDDPIKPLCSFFHFILVMNFDKC